MCTLLVNIYVDFNFLAYLLIISVVMSSGNRMIHFRVLILLSNPNLTLMNCSSRYTLVTINFTVQFLNP